MSLHFPRILPAASRPGIGPRRVPGAAASLTCALCWDGSSSLITSPWVGCGAFTRHSRARLLSPRSPWLVKDHRPCSHRWEPVL